MFSVKNGPLGFPEVPLRPTLVVVIHELHAPQSIKCSMIDCAAWTLVTDYGIILITIDFSWYWLIYWQLNQNNQEKEHKNNTK